MIDIPQEPICIKTCILFEKELAVILSDSEFLGITSVTVPLCCGHPQEPNADCKSTDLGITENTPFSVLRSERCALSIHSDAGKNCFSRLVGESIIIKLLKEKSFLVIPAWLSTWKETLKKWGLDKKSSKAFFRSLAKKVVLLDTGIDPDSSLNLQGFTEYINLPAESIFVGLDYFKLFIKTELMALRMIHNDKNDIQQSRVFQADAFFAALSSPAEQFNETDILKSIAENILKNYTHTTIYFLRDGTAENNRLVFGAEKSNDFLMEMKNWIDKANTDAVLSRDDKGFFSALVLHNTVHGFFGVSGFDSLKDANQCMIEMQPILCLFGILLENAALAAKIETLNNNDSLTELSNRRYFYELGQKELDKANKLNMPLSIIMFDIDFFKSVNDAYGHAAGDEALKTIASFVRNQLKENDFAGRLGGEEFAVMLPETNLRNAHVFAERLRRLIEAAPIAIEGDTIHVTISLGAAGFDGTEKNDTVTMDSIIQRCDEAMYTAKKTGRNRTVDWKSRS